MMFFALVFLVLQLTGASSHHHAYTDHQPDCAACVVADMPAGAPPAAAVVVPVALPAGLRVPVPQPASRVVWASYLTPPSHAPPGAAVFSF